MILLSAIIYNLEVICDQMILLNFIICDQMILLSATIYNLEVTMWSNDFVICNNL